MKFTEVIRNAGRRLLKQAGYDLVRTDQNPAPVARRVRLLRKHGIDVVLDVGANIGQYGWDLRQNGYLGRIVSFEPLSAPYRELIKLARTKPPWATVNVGLGDRSGSAVIHVANNSESSSLLPMLPRHGKADASVRYIGEEQIQMVTLQEIWAEHCQPSNRAFLKIDAQGFERTILQGAGLMLAHAVGIQLELSLVPLYEGETLFLEMVNDMRARGFLLHTVEPMFVDQTTGELLQLDAVFFRALS
jgi:FkbM family methyltransferase